MTINILSPIKKKQIIYSDMRKDLMTNPISGDIVMRNDEDAVKEALKNLLLTDKGERLFQPTVGSNIRKTLFDLINSNATKKILEEEVKSTINNYEPRVNLINTEVIVLENEHRIQINIIFYVRNIQTPVTYTVFLERNR